MKKRKRFFILTTCIMSMVGVGCSSKNAADNSSTQYFSQEHATKDLGSAHHTGKVRIPYTGNRSSIVYVTSASSLPDYEGLESYDDTYFQEHALVLIVETVNSGSIDVGIFSVDMDDSTATVTLYHSNPSGMGTADMATWLIWMEVDSGLDYQWSVANPALKSDAVSY